MSTISCQAVINDRLPMMDEVERGFKEKYEELFVFFGKGHSHSWPLWYFVLGCADRDEQMSVLDDHFPY